MTITNQTPARGYDLPAPTNKLSEDVLRLITALSEVDADVAATMTQVAAKADASHTHAMGDIVGLATALAAKAPASHQHQLSDIQGITITSPAADQVLMYNGSAWVNVAIQIAKVSGLSAALSSLQSQIDTIDGGTF